MPLFRRKDYAVLLVGDVAVFLVSLWLTLCIRYFAPPTWPEFRLHLIPFAILFAVWILVFFLGGLYSRQAGMHRIGLSSQIFYTQAINTAIAALLFFFVPEFGIAPKTILFIYLFISSGLIFLWRMAVFPLTASRKKAPALLVGAGEDFEELRAEINRGQAYPLRFTACLDPACFEPAALLAEIRRQREAERIMVVVLDAADPRIAPAMPELYDDALRGPGFLFLDAYDLYVSVFQRLPLSMLRLPLILHSLERSALFDAVKRVADVAVALVLCLMMVVITPFVALAIKIEDGGRIFVTQRRVGRFQRPVRILKFRSMSGSDRGSEALQSKQVVTRVGRIIRRTHLDELPQAVNLLHGHLSLVGPRPEIVELAEHYAETIPYYHTRHMIKPGLTGWARIRHLMDPHHATNVSETRRKLAYDLYYLVHRSLALDLYIMLQTVRLVITARGS